MNGKWMLTGEVAYEPKSFSPQGDKKASCRVKIKSEDYVGTFQGVPKYRTDYVTLVGFGDTALALGKLQKGDQVAALGRPQAGRPWQKNKDTANATWVADLEMLVDSWELLVSAGGGDAAGEDEGYQLPGDADADFNDPFQSQE